jgi:transcriptional regulator with GAF, ATPase, and Fis domain
MTPSLISTGGPLKGNCYTLAQPEISIGRVSSNDISIENLSVSRRHCVISRAGAAFRIRDLDSHNGTFVNGSPVSEHLLNDGDRIDIGECAFVFRMRVAAPSASDAVRMGAPATARTEAHTVFAPNAPLAREASALMRVSEIARLIQSLYRARGDERKPRESELFGVIFELIPSDRGAVVLRDQFSGEPEPLAGFDRNPSAHGPIMLDPAVAEGVFEAGRAIIGGGGEESWIAAPIVGLSDADEPCGFLWLAASGASRRFIDSDLQMITALAGIVWLALDNARHVEALESENQQLRSERNIEHSMIGDSPGMQKVLRFVARVAKGNSTVLIRGESGTGKELVARAIHRNSPRADKSFIAINCAAITETLLESELFGYEKGAFTGAYTQKKGKIEASDGGTLFLDEIGEMAPPLQAKLLRVLQEHEFERVGGTRTVRVDLRLIAATNRDLEAAIREAHFRSDLFYRLNVVSIDVPPLRERRDDIPQLAAWFAEKFGRAAGRKVTGLSREARSHVMNYSWPGNVRELENAMERAVVLGSSDVITLDDLPDAVLESGPSAASSGKYHDELKQTKKRLIQDALEKSAGNFTEAAKLLGVHPNYLHRLATNLDMRRR